MKMRECENQPLTKSKKFGVANVKINVAMENPYLICVLRTLNFKLRTLNFKLFYILQTNKHSDFFHQIRGLRGQFLSIHQNLFQENKYLPEMKRESM